MPNGPKQTPTPVFPADSPALVRTRSGVKQNRDWKHWLMVEFCGGGVAEGSTQEGKKSQHTTAHSTHAAHIPTTEPSELHRGHDDGRRFSSFFALSGSFLRHGRQHTVGSQIRTYGFIAWIYIHTHTYTPRPREKTVSLPRFYPCSGVYFL